MLTCADVCKVLVGLSTLSLSNQYITSLQGLGVQPGLKTLFLQNNFLQTLDYLFTQPTLKELHLEHTHTHTHTHTQSPCLPSMRTYAGRRMLTYGEVCRSFISKTTDLPRSAASTPNRRSNASGSHPTPYALTNFAGLCV